MAEIIIKENGYKISNNSDDLSSAILAYGYINKEFTSEKHYNYRLLSNDVDFYWGKKGYPIKTLLISYKGNELVKYVDPTSQLVIDYLTKYDSFSRDEIEELVIKTQEVSKTNLESEIEDLKVEKEKLLEQISILKQIEEKKEELKLLLTKLND